MPFTPTQKIAIIWGAIMVLISSALWLQGSSFAIAIVLAYALMSVVDWLDDVTKRLMTSLLAVSVTALLFYVAVLPMTILNFFALLDRSALFGFLEILGALIASAVLLDTVRRGQVPYLLNQLYQKGSH